VVRTPDWLETSGVDTSSLMVGAGLRRAVASGRVRPVATRLSAVPGLLAGRLRPEVAVVGGIEDGGGRWRAVGSPGWAFSVARSASEGLVIERWTGPDAPVVGPLLPDRPVLGVVERVDPPDRPPAHRTGAEHGVIGRLVASLIPDGATVQWGPGAVGASVIDAIYRPVRVRSGLVSDELVGLHRRGLLAAPAVAAYIWGGPDLHAMAANGELRLGEVTRTHDLTALSATPAFVAVNTALQVGLDGSVNIETAAGRVVSGPGGHPDFAAAASRSPGGMSIIALPSTAAGRSSIVARPDVVSTPRCDVDLVVTEHGIADLRGASDRERVRLLAGVAGPEYREGLLAAGATL
jgi:hypothetical protein